MTESQINIGKSRIEKADHQIRLLADIKIDGELRTMYFGVDPQYESGLTVGRADPFLAVMINFAMQTKRNIICEDPVSEKMLFGLRHLYTLALPFWSDAYTTVQIEAEADATPLPSQNAVGAAMSFGCDSMYTFFKHGKGSEYPITHLCNFNNGVYSKEKNFLNHSKMVADYAAKYSLKAVAVDSNIQNVLSEEFLEVFSQRNLACPLALQGLFGTFLYAAGFSETSVMITPEHAAYYDIITVESFSTENLQLMLSGIETDRIGKLKALRNFPDARK